MREQIGKTDRHMRQNIRFFNQSQPQTLQSAQLLLYINAFFGLVNLLGSVPIPPVGILAAPAAIAIANDKRLGWYGAIAVSGLMALVSLTTTGGFSLILSLMFNILLIVLLLHPMSRSHQKIWFK